MNAQTATQTTARPVALGLDPREAALLHDLLALAVTGPWEGPRGTLDGIRAALAEQGVEGPSGATFTPGYLPGTVQVEGV